ncbi:hypothetical protein D3C81_2268120 [compost metagenome]
MKIDPSTPHRPVVRVIAGPEGEPVTPFERDLAIELSIVISDVSDDEEPVKST